MAKDTKFKRILNEGLVRQGARKPTPLRGEAKNQYTGSDIDFRELSESLGRLGYDTPTRKFIMKGIKDGELFVRDDGDSFALITRADAAEEPTAITRIQKAASKFVDPQAIAEGLDDFGNAAMAAGPIGMAAGSFGKGVGKVARAATKLAGGMGRTAEIVTGKGAQYLPKAVKAVEAAAQVAEKGSFWSKRNLAKIGGMGIAGAAGYNEVENWQERRFKAQERADDLEERRQLRDFNREDVEAQHTEALKKLPSFAKQNITNMMYPAINQTLMTEAQQPSYISKELDDVLMMSGAIVPPPMQVQPSDVSSVVGSPQGQ